MLDKKIYILDYGISNIKSLSNALRRLNINYKVVESLKNPKNSSALIFPGVGSFPKAISILKSKKLLSQIQEYAKNGKPILGICLGMQMLFSKGFEFEETSGLNLIEGNVKKIPELNLKLPNIGWRRLIKKYETNDLPKNIEKDFYFVHSYYVEPKDKTIIKYLIKYENFKIPAIIQNKNIYGFQFHPEKSGNDGLVLLKDFFKTIL
tara:strand:+ start:13 stop:633 length:621 start_codon:yes stop_codon:yes gene_type:complete